MKKFLSILLAFCMIVTSMVFVPLTVTAEGASITVNSVDSLNQAVKDIPNGGTIVVDGTIAFADNSAHVIYLGSNTGKTYTITGGTLDFTAVNSNSAPAFINIHDNITFENITLGFDSEKNDFLFACGYKFTVAETVTFTGAKVCLYGGRYLHHNTVNKDKSINVTLLAGNYTSINGASHASGYTVEGDVSITIGGNVTAEILNGAANTIGGNVYVTVGGKANIKTICGAGSATIEGDVYVVVKDNANPNSNPSNSSHNGGGYYVFGGGSGTVKGSTYVYFMDNAKSGYVVGGSNSASGSVGGTANVYMMGGTTYSVYGSGTSVAANANASANIVMTGGTVWQVFGGSEATDGDKDSCINGDITIKLLGGTVKRRVFGGSYNETSIFSWSSSHYVNGTITLIVGENINLNLNTESDNAFSSHSRRSSTASTENGVIIYTNATAKSTHSKKLGTGVAGGKTHENEHIYSYDLNIENEKCVITQTCSEHTDHSATCTFTSPTDAVYNGKEHTVQITDESYSDNWEFEKFAVNYSDNINAGEASARFTIEGVAEVTYNFDIAKASKSAPSIKISNGQVVGITEEMEYSVDGRNYAPYVNGTALSGKIFVRYKETDNTKASNAVKVYANIDMAVNAVEGRVRDTVEIVVYTPYFDGGVSSLTVGYDHDALELVSATNGDVLSGIALNDDVLTFGNATQKSKQGTFVKLSFRIKEGAKGTYEVSISGDGIDAQSGSVAVVEFVRGDVAIAGEDSDGKIDTFDILALREAVVNESTDGVALGADVDGDGNVDSKDVILLCQYLAYYDFEAGESTVTLGANSAE